MSAGAHLNAALAAERDAYAEQLAGRPSAARSYRAARDAYLASHAETGPRSWGRLIGALKMAILADDGVAEVAAQALADAEGVDGPAAGYARALAAVATGAAPDTSEMLAAGDAFARTGRALRRWPTATRPATRPRWARSWPTSRLATSICRAWRWRTRRWCSSGWPSRVGWPSARSAAAAAGRLIRGESAAGLDILRRLGAIAQLGERRAGSAKVTGSSPVSSIPATPRSGRLAQPARDVHPQAWRIAP